MIPWTAACQAPLSMEFSRQEYGSGFSRIPCPSPGDLPNPGIKPGSPTLQADSLPSKPPGKPLYVASVPTIHYSLDEVQTNLYIISLWLLLCPLLKFLSLSPSALQTPRTRVNSTSMPWPPGGRAFAHSLPIA